MTNFAQMFTGLLFCAYVGIHQVRRLVFDNYQTCTLPLSRFRSSGSDFVSVIIATPLATAVSMIRNVVIKGTIQDWLR